MSDALDAAVNTLVEKLDGSGIDSVMRFVIDGAGELTIDCSKSPPQATTGPSDVSADVTVTAAEDVFSDLLAGALNPTAAYMSGKLKIDGDMSAAMKLASALS